VSTLDDEEEATWYERAENPKRDRLLDVFTALMAERGYAAVRVGDVVTHAGCTLATFHALFADKEACMLAAYDRFGAWVIEAIFREIPPDAAWSEYVAGTLRGYIELLEREPTAARAFYIEIDGAGATATRRRRDAVYGFAEMLAERHAELRAREPSLAELPRVAYLGLAFAVRGLIEDTLLDVDGPSLREVAPGIELLANAAVAGAAAARRESPNA
jgi:AcrR family transcriptional regulator